jgi:hypothetical protein
MRVRIDREREERKIATGWFARVRIPAYCLSLTIKRDNPRKGAARAGATPLPHIDGPESTEQAFARAV